MLLILISLDIQTCIPQPLQVRIPPSRSQSKTRESASDDAATSPVHMNSSPVSSKGREFQAEAQECHG